MKSKEIKERQIVFRDEMVRAILNGKKTQTRRLLKNDHIEKTSRYGGIGDRLWVQERFYLTLKDGISLENADMNIGANLNVFYTATEGITMFQDGVELVAAFSEAKFMPRWASRITLEIINIHCQRLNEISEEDVMKEGCPRGILYGTGWYKTQWENIYGRGSWYGNPLVWAIEFKKIDEEQPSKEIALSLP